MRDMFDKFRMVPLKGTKVNASDRLFVINLDAEDIGERYAAVNMFGVFAATMCDTYPEAGKVLLAQWQEMFRTLKTEAEVE